MSEGVKVLGRIDAVFRGLEQGVPQDMHKALDNRVVQVAENFYTIAELLEIPNKEVELLAEQLSCALLNRLVFNAWRAGEGRVFIRGPEVWNVYRPPVHPENDGVVYKLDEVPQEWRMQLGMLQLLDANGTLMNRCGYRHNDNIFYLLEATHESNTQPEQNN